jgi:hypothetical protein
MKRLSVSLLALVVVIGLRAQELTQHTVLFALNASALSKDAELELDQLCAGLETAQLLSVELIGHTDVRGDQAYNEALSQRRALAVRTALQERCFKDTPIDLAWKGKLRPISDGRGEEAHANDRRVEVIVHWAKPQLVCEPVKRTLPEALHAHSKVRPLMPSIDKAREHHVVDANTPIAFVAADGTTVRIPANSLLDRNGQAITGAVDISYRSFHEAYEIVASGIPMHVQSNGAVEHFETAGMYELYASQNGEAVSLAPGATIALQRPEETPLDSDFVGWRLDEATGAWEADGELSATPVAAVEADVSAVTGATAIYWRTLQELNNRLPPDTLSFDERKNSTEYCHLVPCPNNPKDLRGRDKRLGIKYGSKRPTIRVVGHKGIYDPDRIVIEVHLSDDNGFPAWRRLPANAVWEYTGPEPRRLFKRLYARKHYYQDIELVTTPGAESGLLRLKENGEWLELTVSTRWNRTTAAKAARWDRNVAAYNKAESKQRVQFDRSVAQAHARYLRESKDPEGKAWQKAKKAMDPDESALDLNAWMDYADTRRPPPTSFSSSNFNEALATVTTTFGLSGFGVYNIDRIMKMPGRTELIVAAVDDAGNHFPWTNAFAVLNGERSVITYWGRGQGKADNMLVAPGRMKSLFLVDNEGTIMQVDVALLNQRRQRNVALIGSLVKEPTSVDELRADTVR